MPEEFDPYYHWLGIPPQEQPPNHYRLLSLQLYEPNEDVIQHAVDRLMAHIRTFQTGQRAAEAERLLNEISRARICLLNPEKRSRYDQDLRKSFEIARPPSRTSVRTAPPSRGDEHRPTAAAAPPRVQVKPQRVRAKRSAWPRWVGLLGAAAAIVTAGIILRPWLFRDGPQQEQRVSQQQPGPVTLDPDAVDRPPPSGQPQQPLRDDQKTKVSESEPVESTKEPATARPTAPPVPTRPTSPGDLSGDIALVLQDAAGFLGNNAALCQSLAFDSFPAVAARLRTEGLRPVRVRPYVAEGQLLIAACWLRDQVPWQLVWNKTAAELDEAGRALVARGFQPVDVAGYYHGGQTRYVAAYRLGGGDPATVTTTVGLTPESSSQHYARLMTENCYPSTNQIFCDAEGRQCESRVWVKQDPAAPLNWIRFGRRLEDGRPFFRRTDGPLRPMDVTLVASTASGESQLLAYSLNVREDHPAVALQAYSLQEHLDLAVRQARRGYVPIGISVVQFENSPVAVSVWRTRDDAMVAGRTPPVPIGGERRPPASPTTGSPDPASPAPPPATPGESTARPVTKSALPTESELENAAKIVDVRYASMASQAKTPAAKTVLVKQLLSDADNEQDASVRFAIWQRAREVAEQSGMVELAFDAIDQQHAQFETDALQLQSESLKRGLSAAKRSPNRHWLIWQTFQLAEAARIAERFELALELTETAGNAARRSGENEMAKAARDQTQRITFCQELRDAAAGMQNVLASSADDPTANAAQGRYLCFVRGEWADGTRHLALSDDETLARVAAMDQARPESTLEQMAVADGWMALAEQEEGLTREAMWRRAAFWYATALPSSTGETRLRADEQLSLLRNKMGVRSLGVAEKLPWVEGPPGELRQFKGHTSAVHTLDVSSDGRWMVSGSRDGSVRCWDLATGECRSQIATPFRRVGSVAFTLEDRFIVAHGGSKELAVWDVRDGRLTNRLPTGNSYITCMATSNNGELIAWGLRSTASENVLIWDLQRRRGYRSLTSTATVSAMDFSPEGSRLVTCDSGNKVICWDLTTGNRLFQDTTTSPIQQVAFSPNGRHVATLGGQGLLIWDLVRGSIAHQLSELYAPIQMAFLADGTHLVTAGLGEVSVWNVIHGVKTHSVTVGGSTGVDYLRAVAALPDPRAFVVADDRGEIHLWRLEEPPASAPPLPF